MKVILTGGTGFIGRRLTQRLVQKGWQVCVLTRDPEKASKGGVPRVQYLPWGRVEIWKEELDGAEAIVNLAGEPVAQRWTPEIKERIQNSRIGTLKSLENVMTGMRKRPRTLISASAIGYYGSRGDEDLTERSAPGEGFLPETCVKWESVIADFEQYGLRTAWIRIGIVLGTEGGALARLLPLYKFGGGGPIGDGTQWMSWIHITDLVELFVFALENRHVDGALNGTAPSPVRNRDFSSVLAKAVSRPAFLSVPAFGLKLAFGEMASLLVESQKVLPKRTQEEGYSFQFTELESALRTLVA